jgi:glyoxylase I family protein
MAATSPAPVPAPEPARAPVAAFSHVQLQVRDVPASERWYTTVFGMDRLAADPQGTYVALRHPPSRIVIVLSQRGDGAGDESALDHLAFGVRDETELRQWADHLASLGIEHPGVAPELDNLTLQLRDPDGTSIELVTRNPASRTPHNSAGAG